MAEEGSNVKRRFVKLKEDSSTSALDKSSGWSSDDSEDIALDVVSNFRVETEELHREISEQFENRFQGMLKRLNSEVRKTKKRKDKHINEHDEHGDKIFRPRDSLLTELFEVSHVQTIYNIFIAFLFIFIMNTMIHDYLVSGKFVDFSPMLWMFGDLSVVVWTWMKMQFFALLAYPLLSAFASNQTSIIRLPIGIWLAGYVLYMSVIFYVPLSVISKEDLPPAGSAIIVTEQVRLVMKIHAFMRTNATRLCKQYHKNQEEGNSKKSLQIPGFSQYLYFFFIPTLIYRDHYPRTPRINWDFVVVNLVQVIGCIFYVFFLFARYIVPAFENIGKETGNIRNLLKNVMTCMLPGMLLLLVAFFGILHSWMNAFAEMTTFADRMFYRAWWNCNSFSSYYRTWNVIVHDWLYAYIYRDLLYLLGGEKSRGYAAISVFIISAVIHEYVLAVMFRFFYPLLLIMFGGVGVLFFFVKPSKGSKSPIWNIYVWVSLSMGSGILMALYSVEWYASRNCNRINATLLDYAIPYSLDTRCVKWEWK